MISEKNSDQSKAPTHPTGAIQTIEEIILFYDKSRTEDQIIYGARAKSSYPTKYVITQDTSLQIDTNDPSNNRFIFPHIKMFGAPLILRLHNYNIKPFVPIMDAYLFTNYFHALVFLLKNKRT